MALCTTALTTSIAWFLRPYITPSDQVMIFLAGVLFVAHQSHLRTALLTSLLSVACFDFFFVLPFYTFYVYDYKYLITFSFMAIFGGLVSGLFARIRLQATTARTRQALNARLFEMTRQLATCADAQRICAVSAAQLRDAFGADVTIFLKENTDQLTLAATYGDPLTDEHSWATARWVGEHLAWAGPGSANLPDAHCEFAPLFTNNDLIAVLGLRWPHTPQHTEQRALFEHMIAQISQALERQQLLEASRKAELKLNTERMRNSLLSSLSHDVRTPVASIIGAAELLRDRAAELEPIQHAQLVESVCTEAIRLQQLVENLLQITRIEGGGLALRRDWHFLEELVGATLAPLEHSLAGRTVTTSLCTQLVFLDATSVTTALRNLVENAARHSPATLPIHIHGECLNGEVILSVLDQGSGIAEHEVELIFGKFYRGANATQASGYGLGLAIVRAVADAHGGRTFARCRHDGPGALVGFSINQLDAPEPPPVHTEPQEGAT